MEGNRAEGNAGPNEGESVKIGEKLGLSTTEALDILHRDVTRILDEYEADCQRNK